MVIILITLLVIGSIQTLGLILRYVMIKDNTVPYAKGIAQYFYLYIAYFMVLSSIYRITETPYHLELAPLAFIIITGPIMAMRYFYVTHCLAKKHDEYV